MEFEVAACKKITSVRPCARAATCRLRNATGLCASKSPPSSTTKSQPWFSGNQKHERKPQMNTAEDRAAPPQPKNLTTKTRRREEILCNSSCLRGEQDTCAPRDDLRVSAVRFGVQALACYGPRAA